MGGAMSRLPESAGTPDSILTLEDAAALFGVSVKTFIKLLREEDVPARKIGREWRFSSEALFRWLGEGRSRQYSDSDQETRRFFDAIATGYDATKDHAFEAEMLGALAVHCAPASGALHLDYGAGTGVIAQWIAGLQAQVLALDVSSGMLAELNRQAAAKGLSGIATRLCEMGEVPVADATVSRVYASFSLHHVPEPAQTLLALRRCMTADGCLAVVEYVPYQDEAWQESRHDTWPGLSADAVAQWLREAGFRQIRKVWEQQTPEGRQAYLTIARVDAG